MKTDAGMADLDVAATSPLGQELPLQVTPLNDGAEMVEFSPSVPGTYMINITYGKTNVHIISKGVANKHYKSNRARRRVPYTW